MRKRTAALSVMCQGGNLRLPRKKLDYFFLSFACLAFWYAYYSIESETIGMKGSRYNMLSDPIKFWISITFVIGFGGYCVFWALSNESEST